MWFKVEDEYEIRETAVTARHGVAGKRCRIVDVAAFHPMAAVELVEDASKKYSVKLDDLISASD